MAKKLKDFVVDILSTAGIKSNEISFIGSASDINEVEISDELATKFHSNMFSIDAAKNNADLGKHFRTSHWAEFATIIDNRISTDAFPHLDDVQKTTLNEIKNTPDKVGKVLDFLAARKPKADDSELQKKYDALALKVTGDQSTYEGQMSTLKDSHSQELEKKDSEFKDYKINDLIKSNVNNRVLIDNIPGGKNYLAESTVVAIRKDPRFVLGLDSSGSGLVFNDRNDPTKKYFENNKEVVLDQVVGPIMKEGNWEKNSPGPPSTKNKPDPIVPDRPLTFHEANAIKSRENAAEMVANRG